jgi:hypothetical protein
VIPISTQDAESAMQAAGLRVVIAPILPITGADASSNGYAIRSTRRPGQRGGPAPRCCSGSPTA